MGKVAVVTGAAGGMGRAIVARLIADGMVVYGLDVDADGLAQMVQPGFAGIVTDLMVSTSIRAAFDQIATAKGGVDALVNNAGTCLMSEFPDIPEQEFERQMALNFSGAFHCCQAAIKLMAGREGVRKIVNISSNGAYNFDAFDPPPLPPLEGGPGHADQRPCPALCAGQNRSEFHCARDDGDAVVWCGQYGGSGRGDCPDAAWARDAALRDSRLGWVLDFTRRGCVQRQCDHS